MPGLTLLPLIIVQVSSFIVIKKINFNFHPSFGKATVGIEILPNGTTTMNVDANLTKPLNGKALITPSIYYMRDQRRITAMRVPPINYCDMMRGQLIPLQLVQAFIDRVAQFGRLIVPCPILPGHYYLNNFFIDETQLPMYRLLQENFLIILEVIFNQDFMGKKVPVFNIQGTFTVNRTNWPK